MATASEILSAIAPQFDDAPGRQTILDLSESRTSETRFGTQRSEAVAYRAAHIMALSGSQTGAWSGGGIGAIASKKEGDLAVSFHGGQSTGEAAYWSQTGYGQMLLDMLRSRPAMGVTGQPFTPFSIAGMRRP